VKRASNESTLLILAASFAAGAAAVWLLGRLWTPRVPAEESYTDAQLRERVRLRIADMVADPDAIEVDVEDAVVRVRGNVSAAELHPLLMELSGMPGVSRVRNALSARDRGQDASAAAAA